MRLFRTNWDRLVLLLLPIQLRVAVNFVLFRAMIQSIYTLNDRFLANRTDNLYKLKHNGQVCYLRAMLNDSFDITNRRIMIEDTGRNDWTFVYNEAQNKPLLLETVIIVSEHLTNDEGTDFTVKVPAEFSPLQSQIISLVNYYKLAGKRYSIVFN